METVQICPLTRVSRRMQAILREGQQEAARVWNACKDLHQEARRHGARGPNRDALQKATKGRFALHSRTVQMVVHAF